MSHCPGWKNSHSIQVNLSVCSLTSYVSCYLDGFCCLHCSYETRYCRKWMHTVHGHTAYKEIIHTRWKSLHCDVDLSSAKPQLHACRTQNQATWNCPVIIQDTCTFTCMETHNFISTVYYLCRNYCTHTVATMYMHVYINVYSPAPSTPPSEQLVTVWGCGGVGNRQR